MEVTFDQCSFGLRSPAGALVQKRTTFWTNSQAVKRAFDQKFCTGEHPHRKIEGSELGISMSAHCAIYPPGLCAALADAIESEWLQRVV